MRTVTGAGKRYENRDVDLKRKAVMIAVQEPVWHKRPGKWKDERALQEVQDRIEEDGLPVFRKEFVLEREAEEAWLDMTSLGVFHVFINGQAVTGEQGIREELNPGWTDYRKRLLCVRYRVDRYLRQGENCILAAVGSGWWQGRISFGTYGRRELGLWGCLEVRDSAGTVRTLATGPDWSGAWLGPVRYSDIWDGEVYDAREDSFEEMSLAGYDKKVFGPVHVAGREGNEPDTWMGYEGKITPWIGPKVQVREELTRQPVEAAVGDGIRDNGTDFGEIHVVKQISDWPLKQPLLLLPGQTLTVDLGQNMVGWEYFKARAGSGTRLTIRFGEMLNDSGELSRGNDGPKGSVYTANYRSARSLGRYIFKGSEEPEEYRPCFTYYGFRYLELTADGPVELYALEGQVVGSVIRETGSLTTSSGRVNRLIRNILWGQRGNYFSVPTDCPQRNERLGWTGDAQVFFRTAAYNGDVEDFYWKWLQDARDSQNEEGGYPDVIPYTRVIRYGNGAWADGCILIPYRLYLQYGSRDILEVSVESMERYMDFLSRYGLEGPNMEFGDWLAYEPTDKRYVSMAWYAYDAMTMETIEKILGRQEKALEYRSLYEQIREAFLSRYGKEEGLLSEQSQTAYLLALMARLLPESREEEAVSLLEKKIRNNGHLLSTGFVGTGILMNILGRYGRHHMAYDLLMQRNNPSWLYSVDQGATTIWERWNSYGRSFGFGDVSMNSFNHYAYGCVGEWMYRYMAGIDTSEIHPGFEEVILQPKPDLRVSVPEGGEQITWVKASYESRLGRIQVQWQWEREERRFSCQVSLAEGMRGIFCLPEIDGIRRVRLNGEELSWESGRTVRLSGGEWKIVME